MPDFYPIVLNLQGRRCLVIGGGLIAERKVEGLLAAGAAVTLLSPTVSNHLAALIASGRIDHVARGYRSGDLHGFTLAFAATDDGAVSPAVAAEGRARGVWVNAADDPASCDFLLPGVVRRGPLVVAVSTGGASPALTRAVRRELDAYFAADYAVFAEMVADVRRELRALGRRPSGHAWSRALDPDLLGLITEGRCEDARRRLLERLVCPT